MQAKEFREDLFHRLNVVQLSPPPLRERAEDIPLLVSHFVKGISREMGRSAPALHSSAKKALMEYTFPGNVRELRNIVERALILCDDEIRASHLRIEEIGNIFYPQKSPPVENGLELNLERNIRGLAEQSLLRTNGNVSAAAKLMGIDRSKLNRILAKSI